MEGVVAASDPYGYLGITVNPDGSITRTPFPTTAASSDPAGPSPVLTMDVPINPQTATCARLYLPRHTTTKLPLIVYFHGGGLILCTAANTAFQKFCHNVVLKIPALMVSVDYRLAPEHRLPAAYHDGLEALHWVRASDEEWLAKFADLSNCFLMGSSAGGNVTYVVGLSAAALADQLAPLQIRGLVLHHAFFGGVERTPMEMRSEKDRVIPPCVTDIMWELALPEGADRDHEYCNPTKDVDGEAVEKVRERGWRVLVTGCEGDVMIDRQMEVGMMLKERGVDVWEQCLEGGHHGIDMIHADGAHANSVYEVLKNFVLAETHTSSPVLSPITA